jgi:hypothetical protein
MPKNVLGTTLSTSFQGSTDYKIFGSDGTLYQGGNQIFNSSGAFIGSKPVQGISFSTGGGAMAFSSTQITAFGFTYLYPSTYGTTLGSSHRGQLGLDNPVIGGEKTILFDNNSTNVILDIKLIGTGIFGTSDYSTKLATKIRYIHFSTLLNEVQGLNLIGLSTSIWAVKSILGSSSISWQDATGIRTSTSARSS